MPETLTKTISFAEYLLSPYDGKRTELVDGEIIEMSEASPLHVLIITFLQQLLIQHIHTQKLSLACYAGTGIEIPRSAQKNNARDPDLVVCEKAQFKAMRHLTKAVFLEGNPPALAIEVASPGNVKRDTEDKREEYALAKVPEYWIVNPVDGYVLTLRLNGDRYEAIGEYRGTERIESVLFPKLRITATNLLDPQ